MMYLTNLLFYISVCGLFLNYSYFLKSLMMMEFCSMSIIMVMMISVYSVPHYIIFILILSVCESILGLLVVVLICRAWGVDSYILVDYNI